VLYCFYIIINREYNVQTFSKSTDMFRLLDRCIPDIMLLDINLTGEDGREICKAMRTERNYNKPILYISGNQYTLEKVLGSCANGFIAKPFDLKEFTKVVESFIAN
jgi:DNA-binding response OmpR family regulator